ncbi:MAG: hypothetical protein OJI74_16295 [Rhodanobacter thiooxydans]|nr:hypothetical protein [Rhodanobacter thiooxydans]
MTEPRSGVTPDTASGLFADDALRSALREMPEPSPSHDLQQRLLAGAPHRRPRVLRGWMTGLVLCSLLAAVALGVFEYRAWQTTEELALLDELSVASMLLL